MTGEAPPPYQQDSMIPWASLAGNTPTAASLSKTRGSASTCTATVATDSQHTMHHSGSNATVQDLHQAAEGADYSRCQSRNVSDQSSSRTLYKICAAMSTSDGEGRLYGSLSGSEYPAERTASTVCEVTFEEVQEEAQGLARSLGAETDSSSPVAASGTTDAEEQLSDALNHLEVVNAAAPLGDTAAIAAQSEQQPDIPANLFASEHLCQLLPADLVLETEYMDGNIDTTRHPKRPLEAGPGLPSSPSYNPAEGESADLPLDGSDADQDLHALENALRIMEHDSRLPPATNRNNQRPSSPALHVPVSSPAVKVDQSQLDVPIDREPDAGQTGTTEPSEKPKEELHPDEAPASPLPQQSSPASSPSKEDVSELSASCWSFDTPSTAQHSRLNAMSSSPTSPVQGTATPQSTPARTPLPSLGKLAQRLHSQRDMAAALAQSFSPAHATSDAESTPESTERGSAADKPRHTYEDLFGTTPYSDASKDRLITPEVTASAMRILPSSTVQSAQKAADSAAKGNELSASKQRRLRAQLFGSQTASDASSTEHLQLSSLRKPFLGSRCDDSRSCSCKSEVVNPLFDTTSEVISGADPKKDSYTAGMQSWSGDLHKTLDMLSAARFQMMACHIAALPVMPQASPRLIALAGDIKHLNAILRQGISSQAQQLHLAKGQIQSRDDFIRVLEHSVASLEAQLQQEGDSSQQAQQELAARLQLSESALAASEVARTKMEAQLQDSQSRLQESEACLTASQSACSKLHQEASELKGQLQATAAALADSEKASAQLKEQHEKMRDDLESHVAELAQEKQSMEGKLHDELAVSENLANSLGRTQQDVRVLNGKICFLQNSTAALQKSNSSLTEEVQQLKQTLQEVTADCERYRDSAEACAEEFMDYQQHTAASAQAGQPLALTSVFDDPDAEDARPSRRHPQLLMLQQGSSAEPGNGRILALEAPKASQRNAPAPSSAPRRPFQRAASRPPMQICIATTEFAAPAPSTAQRRFLSVRRTPRIPLLTDLATAHKHSLLQADGNKTPSSQRALSPTQEHLPSGHQQFPDDEQDRASTPTFQAGANAAEDNALSSSDDDDELDGPIGLPEQLALHETQAKVAQQQLEHMEGQVTSLRTQLEQALSDKAKLEAQQKNSTKGLAMDRDRYKTLHESSEQAVTQMQVIATEAVTKAQTLADQCAALDSAKVVPAGQVADALEAAASQRRPLGAMVQLEMRLAEMTRTAEAATESHHCLSEAIQRLTGKLDTALEDAAAMRTEQQRETRKTQAMQKQLLEMMQSCQTLTARALGADIAMPTGGQLEETASAAAAHDLDQDMLTEQSADPAITSLTTEEQVTAAVAGQESESGQPAAQHDEPIVKSHMVIQDARSVAEALHMPRQQSADLQIHDAKLQAVEMSAVLDSGSPQPMNPSGALTALAPQEESSLSPVAAEETPMAVADMSWMQLANPLAYQSHPKDLPQKPCTGVESPCAIQVAVKAPSLAHLGTTGTSTLCEADPANSPGVLTAKRPRPAKENKPKAERGPLTLVASLAKVIATNVLTGRTEAAAAAKKGAMNGTLRSLFRRTALPKTRPAQPRAALQPMVQNTYAAPAQAELDASVAEEVELSALQL